MSMEDTMTSSPLHDRRQQLSEEVDGLSIPPHPSTIREAIIRAFRSEDREAFRRLNEAWIEARIETRIETRTHDGLVIEPEDMEMLCDPETHIIGRGGWIYVAIQKSELVGCFALVPACDETLQLVIMTVRHDLCVEEIGCALLHRAIATARALQASSIVLETSSGRKDAVHLYEAMGFQRLARNTNERAVYTRADLSMKLPLTYVASESRSAAHLC